MTLVMTAFANAQDKRQVRQKQLPEKLMVQQLLLTMVAHL